MTDTDVLLNKCGDEKLVEGDEVIVGGIDRVRQSWLIHMNTFQGELMRNTLDGMPYVQKLFKKGISRQEIEKIFTDKTLEVPGVLSVNSVSLFDFNSKSRKYKVEVDCIGEGEEQALFYYYGDLPADGCSVESGDVPPDVGNLIVRFDASDSDNTYLDYGVLRMENIAGAGYAIGEAISGVYTPEIVESSPLGGKRAVFLNNTYSNGNEGVIRIFDTRALRPAGLFTAFIVVRVLTDTSHPNYGETNDSSSWPLIDLSGNDETDTNLECLTLTCSWTFEVQTATSMVLRTITESGPSDTSYAGFTAPRESSFVSIIDFNVAGLDIYRNYSQDSTDMGFVSRNLDGGGRIGAQFGSSCDVLSSNRSYMYFGEILIYDGGVSPVDIPLVRSWLIDKWNIS